LEDFDGILVPGNWAWVGIPFMADSLYFSLRCGCGYLRYIYYCCYYCIYCISNLVCCGCCMCCIVSCFVVVGDLDIVKYLFSRVVGVRGMLMGVCVRCAGLFGIVGVRFVCVCVVGLLLYVFVSNWYGHVMVGCWLFGDRWWSLWQGALLVFWTCAKEGM
jgi:hypothetical protein